MKIYQFIKYNNKTSISHIKHYGNDDLILCFDFEDGIQNGLDESQTEGLKEKHRQYFIDLLPKFDNNCKIGIRVNTKNSNEFKKDLFVIKDKSFHSIFLPKIQTTKELISIIKSIDDNNIKYEEIVPIIEDKTGLEYLDRIIKVTNIKNIAFGHCDYNLSLGVFPFFHHKNHEYWKWVNKILSVINKENVCFINSAYLSYNDIDFFGSMINHLGKITNNNFGQFTLSNIHTKACLNSKEDNSINFAKLLNNRHQLYSTNEDAKNVVNSYEVHHKGLGLSRNSKEIISYQEYIAAKKLISNKYKTANITFVGGCLAVQHNILYDDMFLVKSKKNVEAKLSINLNIDIIRYERFTTLLDKIIRFNKTKNIDILILSVRPEPFLRIIKLYYKYINNEGKLKKSLNIPFLNIINPEKYDYLILGRLYDYSSITKNSQIHKSLVSLNYISGALIGNLRYALNKYIELVKSIEEYCINRNIELVLLGPNLRNNNAIEPYFCKKLDKEIRTIFPKNYFINGLDTLYKDKKVINENGIHANELFHDMISTRINDVLIDILRPK